MGSPSTPYRPNRCECGHDLISHPNGTCFECNGGQGNAHPFSPENSQEQRLFGSQPPGYYASAGVQGVIESSLNVAFGAGVQSVVLPGAFFVQANNSLGAMLTIDVGALQEAVGPIYRVSGNPPRVYFNQFTLYAHAANALVLIVPQVASAAGANSPPNGQRGG